jgi:ABC-type phosphate transport system substrate-binding protein
VGEPEGTVKAYLDWIMSEEGQSIVRELGFVPL